MPKQKVEIEVDVPEGWKATGKFAQKCAVLPGGEDDKRGTIALHLALEPTITYRNVTAADVGKPIQWRWPHEQWRNGLMVGVTKSGRIAFEVDDRVGGVEAEDARIVDDGQPAKVSREWWLYQVDNDPKLFVGYREQPGYRKDDVVFHVREVVE